LRFDAMTLAAMLAVAALAALPGDAPMMARLARGESNECHPLDTLGSRCNKA
jgi:hypothetical protein